MKTPRKPTENMESTPYSFLKKTITLCIILYYTNMCFTESAYVCYALYAMLSQLMISIQWPHIYNLLIYTHIICKLFGIKCRMAKKFITPCVVGGRCGWFKLWLCMIWGERGVYIRLKLHDVIYAYPLTLHSNFNSKKFKLKKKIRTPLLSLDKNQFLGAGWSPRIQPV